MKNFKLITALSISLLFINCLTNIDEKEVDPTLVNDEPDITFNVDAVITQQPDSDITELVTFNGEPSSTYTSTLKLEETLTIGKPKLGNPSDEVRYINVKLFRNNEEVALNFETQTSEDGNLKLVIPEGKPFNYYFPENVDNIDIVSFKAVNAEDNVDIDYKYDLEVKIIRNGIAYGPYFIDPKIKIRSRD